MTRLWVRVMRRHRIARDAALPCAWGDQYAALQEACKRLDLPNPLWLSKHEDEFERFRRTAFTPDHFVEAVDFDRLEIEFLDDEHPRRDNRDPRNEF